MEEMTSLISTKSRIIFTTISIGVTTGRTTRTGQIFLETISL